MSFADVLVGEFFRFGTGTTRLLKLTATTYLTTAYGPMVQTTRPEAPVYDKSPEKY